LYIMVALTLNPY